MSPYRSSIDSLLGEIKKLTEDKQHLEEQNRLLKAAWRHEVFSIVKFFLVLAAVSTVIAVPLAAVQRYAQPYPVAYHEAIYGVSVYSDEPVYKFTNGATMVVGPDTCSFIEEETMNTARVVALASLLCTQIVSFGCNEDQFVSKSPMSYDAGAVDGTVDGSGSTGDLVNLAATCPEAAVKAKECIPPIVDDSNRATALACMDSKIALASDKVKMRLHDLAFCYLNNCGPVGANVVGANDVQNPCAACKPEHTACFND